MSGLVDEVYPVDPQEKKNQPVWECLAYKYWTVIANKVPGFSQCSGQSHGVGVAKNDKVEWLLYCLRVSADQMLLLLTAQQALGSKDVMEKDCFNGMTVIIKKFGVYVWADKIKKKHRQYMSAIHSQFTIFSIFKTLQGDQNTHWFAKKLSELLTSCSGLTTLLWHSIECCQHWLSSPCWTTENFLLMLWR